MKVKRKLSVGIVLVLLIAVIFTGYLLYIPPLFDRSGYNIPGWIYNFFYYVYYSSRMEWLKNEGEIQAARRAAAQAAWYRPGRMEDLLELNPDDLFQLGWAYADLELEQEAIRLFREVTKDSIAGEQRGIDIISSLAIMGDWAGASQVADKLLRKNPDSGVASYWRGRAFLELGNFNRAIKCLEQSLELEPGLTDAVYQLGRAAMFSGRKTEAMDLFKETVRILPNHAGAWKMLSRLLTGSGDTERRNEALERCRELTPSVPLKKRICNRAILRGYRMGREVLTNEPILIEFFVEGWDTEDHKLEMELELKSNSGWQKLIIPVKSRPVPETGDMIKISVNRRLPMVLYPGEISLKAVFKLPDTTAPGGRKIIGEEGPPLLKFNLKPGWTETRSRPVLIKESFGSGAWTPGKQTFLGPQDELDLMFKVPRPAIGLGIVSYLHSGSSISQGTTVGMVYVESEAGTETSYPVIVGRDTAEVWWGYADLDRRKHEQAPIFRSWPVKSAGRSFQGCEYYTLFSFPHTVIRGLRFQNCLTYSGWYIPHIILIPPEVLTVRDNSD